MKALEFINNMGMTYGQANEEYIRLKQEYNLLNMMQSDLLHKIETSTKANACEGYLYFASLRELRIKRRTVKNEMLAMEIALENIKLKEKKKKDLEKQMKKVFKSKYKSRILDLDNNDVLIHTRNRMNTRHDLIFIKAIPYKNEKEFKNLSRQLKDKYRVTINDPRHRKINCYN